MGRNFFTKTKVYVFYILSGECSGNGSPIEEQCQTSCRCTRGWTGPCCSERQPNRGFGDPHLETLDGNIDNISIY